VTQSRKPAPKKTIAVAPKAGIEPTPRHPNLGLAPIDMTAGYAEAADRLRGDVLKISAVALQAAVLADPSIPSRFDEVGLRMLLRDGELLIERLALCLASGETRWLTEYAEWIGPTQRRRRVSLGDLAALCAGIRETVEARLSPQEFASAAASLDAAIDVFRRNGRIGGDRHKRNPLLRWMYRGV
jgi:hypothetical protein